MSQDLKSALEDLVAEGPPDLLPHDLAEAAWSQGRRRRRLRRVTVVSVVLAVLCAGVVAFPFVHRSQQFAPADGLGSTSVSGYPERIGHQWWVRDLPDSPGPMALLTQRVVHHDSYDQPAGWEAVSESGQRWRLPGIYGLDYPSLSPGGRKLGYLAGEHGPYVIRDLVSGQVTTFPAIGSSSLPGQTTYMAQGQSPAFWSPDGQHLVMAGFRDDPTYSGRALVLGMDGSVQLASGPGFPAGWVNANTIVWLGPANTHGRKRVPVDVQFIDLSGHVRRSLTLSKPMRPGSLSGQWTAAVSPDATETLVSQQTTFSTRIRRFSLVDGEPVGRAKSVSDVNDTCPLGWAGSTPVVSILGQDNAYPAELTSTGVNRLIAIEPRVGTQCVVWAAEALAGTRQAMPFGLSMTPWTWWWREILFAGLVTGLLTWYFRRWVVVKRRRRLKAPQPFVGKG